MILTHCWVTDKVGGTHACLGMSGLWRVPHPLQDWEGSTPLLICSSGWWLRTLQSLEEVAFHILIYEVMVLVLIWAMGSLKSESSFLLIKSVTVVLINCFCWMCWMAGYLWACWMFLESLASLFLCDRHAQAWSAFWDTCKEFKLSQIKFPPKAHLQMATSF